MNNELRLLMNDGGGFTRASYVAVVNLLNCLTINRCFECDTFFILPYPNCSTGSISFPDRRTVALPSMSYFDMLIFLILDF